MIIETTANQFYRVTEPATPGLDHCWHGFSVKKFKGGYCFTAAGKRDFEAGRPSLVRKAGCRIIEA